MSLVKIRAPICLFYKGAYVAPGTEIEMEEDEARRLTDTHGEIDTEMTLSADDRASIDTLNKHHAINGGGGDTNG